MKRKLYIRNFFKWKRRIIFIFTILTILIFIFTPKIIFKSHLEKIKHKNHKKIEKTKLEIHIKEKKDDISVEKDNIKKEIDVISDETEVDIKKANDNRNETNHKDEEHGIFIKKPDKQSEILIKNNNHEKDLIDFENDIKNIAYNDLRNVYLECLLFIESCSLKYMSDASVYSWMVYDWFRFFSDLYDEIIKSRFILGPDFVLGPDYKLNWNCKIKLKHIVTIFNPTMNKLMQAMEKARKMGLYPGEVRDILEKYEINMYHMEELCQKMDQIKEELDLWDY